MKKLLLIIFFICACEDATVTTISRAPISNLIDWAGEGNDDCSCN